ncbi:MULTISPECIES: hypothetical protein [Streptomyces]|uniref:Uncharacterized protein n=1 Tax=Streptomyces venezuelae (strain ATCC 10712 / CBS 650.69 / DSM 40230 / JCM 4526 / NBRC 13096 / PD 04745) TaxID=953739 RepID=F2R0S8_STRVP|nr:hypothetical protein [Streptomyces venezuelae]APE21419.1 hypothetical protein vnz_10545 [Streptomyces venezuelae]QER98807.1 hypothetical protein DEJ43_10690 [Streptomyces venezuelae ATCC 10712]CCA55445.1 hypothetical protein SVEN_2159 [Streptomyces venezuelae ATCC 10712]
MSTTDPYGQSISIAALTDAPNAQALAAGIADAVAPRTVMRFTSASARTAALTGAAAPVAGMVTYLATEDRYEGRMADGTWQALSPGPWIPIEFASGFVARFGSPAYRVVNGAAEMRGNFEKSDGTPFTKGVALTIINLPAAVHPPAYRYFTCATELAADVYCRIEVTPDGDVQLVIPTSTGTAASWASLDNVRYSLT